MEPLSALSQQNARVSDKPFFFTVVLVTYPNQFDPLTMFTSVFSTIFLQVGDLIGDIFEAGFWVAIILIALVVGGGYWLFKKLKGRNRH